MGALTEKLKLQKKKKKKNLWWRSEDKRTTSPSLSHLDFFRSPPTRTTHPPTNFFQSTSRSYLLLVVLLFTILVGFFCSFCYWYRCWLDPAMAHTRTHDTCAVESVATTVTTAAAAGARHFWQKACLFCRQTSFETLKIMAFRVWNSIILTFFFE